MIRHEQLIRARLGILTMAAEIKSVAKVCKLAGVSRSQFYAMKKAYATYGREGLAPRHRRKPQMPNRTPAAIEHQILLKTQIDPTISYIKLAEAIKLDGTTVTATMVRYVWQRHGLSTRTARIRWVKAKKESLNGAKVKGAANEVRVLGSAAGVPATAIGQSSPVPLAGSV